MKLKFDPGLDFQRDAINAVVDVFDGQTLAAAGAVTLHHTADDLIQNDLGMANRLTLGDDALLANVRRIQEANGIEKATELKARSFSVEMETGTGKTYVYLRTIFELNRQYGFRKFIIVVPGVAVREGVLKSIDMMRDHFRTLYDNVTFAHFVYDARRLGHVRQFANSDQIQIMIINIQAFVKVVADKPESEMTADELQRLNIINRETDRLSGHRPIEFIQAASPFVIIDEPQSVDTTPKARRAIANLCPTATFRYSATHRDPENLLYRLDPVKAWDLRLVKRIEVAAVRSDDNFNAAWVKLLQTDNRKRIRARIEIHKDGANGPKAVKMWVSAGDDLFAKSGRRAAYKDGCIVRQIDCTPGYEGLELSSGHRLCPGQETGGFGDDIMKAQIHETVEQHLRKERDLRETGVKVLSLFFIDRVANYRVYNDDGTTGLGKIGRWFEESFRELTQKSSYRGLIPHDAADVHDGYFSRDRHGKDKDTRRGDTRDDADTYALIMRDKERLLDRNVPLRFIFSHSALREGWDNPNVFQICTLNETRSVEKKRQEIGRGLRLPVNEKGERVRDETVNRLTVIANESYENFARTLQDEIEQDFGIRFGRVEKIDFARLTVTRPDGDETPLGQEASARLWRELVDGGYLNEAGEILDQFDPDNPHFTLKVSDEFDGLQPGIVDALNRKVFKNRIVNVRDRRELAFHKEVHLSPAFRELWDRIKYRTRYRVAFETEDLIAGAVERIKHLDSMKPVHITTTRVGLDITEAGVDATEKLDEKSVEATARAAIPDILAFLQKETELTRHTLTRILRQSGRLAEFGINPQAFMAAVAGEISRALRDLMLDGIQYDKIAGQHWEMSRIEREAEKGIIRYLSNLYEVENKNKTLFDAIECDSRVERRFAQELDNHEHVRLFVKLPAWFKIDTPVGPYNPDWAFMTECGEKLYFVRETKGSLDPDDRRETENRKIECGKKHFGTLNVDFDVVTSLADVDMRRGGSTRARRT